MLSTLPGIFLLPLYNNWIACIQKVGKWLWLGHPFTGISNKYCAMGRTYCVIVRTYLFYYLDDYGHIFPYVFYFDDILNSQIFSKHLQCNYCKYNTVSLILSFPRTLKWLSLYQNYKRKQTDYGHPTLVEPALNYWA